MYCIRNLYQGGSNSVYFTENISFQIYFKDYVKFCMLWKKWKIIKNLYHSTWKVFMLSNLHSISHLQSQGIKPVTKTPCVLIFIFSIAYQGLRLRRVPFISPYCNSSGLAGVLKISVTSRLVIIWGIKKGVCCICLEKL